MPRIRFTAAPKLPADLAHLGYKKGDEVELSQDQCDRWIRRNVAALVADKPARGHGGRGAAKPPENPPPGDAGPAALDPQTATVEALRAFFAARGQTPPVDVTEAELRAAAVEFLARESKDA